jgi:hypothetical protein
LDKTELIYYRKMFLEPKSLLKKLKSYAVKRKAERGRMECQKVITQKTDHQKL